MTRFGWATFACTSPASHLISSPMKRLLLCVSLAAGTFAVHAQPTVDELSKCLAENTTGRDRKDLAKWIFVAMAAHPDMKAVANIAASAPTDSSRTAGLLFTKLIAESCPDQTKAAIAAVGPVALQSAFTVLGQLAMQELVADKDVAAGMGLLQKYVDSEKLKAVLDKK